MSTYWRFGLFLLALSAVACGSSATAPSGDPPPEAAPPPPEPDPTARYRVSFEATWSARTHPDRFPANPHFSPLVGATHSGARRFWAEGELASEGIERMAELGAISPLDDIIRAAIDAGTAHGLLLGDGIARSPGSVSLEFEITRDFPFVTLVSMIAPSPDWFVGISAENFLDSGDWPDELTIELSPYDAGTDSGLTYDAPDRDTVPAEPISRITRPPLGSGGTAAPLGTFTFTRIDSGSS